MTPDEIIYTDGKDVVVTRSTFQVKNTFYMLHGITKHGLSIIKPKRAPGALMIIVGLLIILGAILNFIPVITIKNLLVDDKIMIGLGSLLVLGGCFVTLFLKEKYSLRIDTAEGEKDAVVSTQREYIAQIVTALNRAFMVLERPKVTNLKY